MTFYSLITIELLIVLGLVALFPAVVVGVLGTYFHGRHAHRRDRGEKRVEEVSLANATLNRKHPGKREGKEYMSLTEALEPGVVKLPPRTPPRSGPRKAA